MFKVNNTHSTPCSSVSIVNFEHVIAGWVVLILQYLKNVFPGRRKRTKSKYFMKLVIYLLYTKRKKRPCELEKLKYYEFNEIRSISHVVARGKSFLDTTKSVFFLDHTKMRF